MGHDLAERGATLRRLESISRFCRVAMPLIPPAGYRPGEIRHRLWYVAMSDWPASFDAKTGPRHGLPGEAARKPRDNFVEANSREWAFPGTNGGGPLTNGALYWWCTEARVLASLIAGAWIQDLRYAHTPRTRS